MISELLGLLAVLTVFAAYALGPLTLCILGISCLRGERGLKPKILAVIILLLCLATEIIIFGMCADYVARYW